MFLSNFDFIGKLLLCRGPGPGPWHTDSAGRELEYICLNSSRPGAIPATGPGDPDIRIECSADACLCVGPFLGRVYTLRCIFMARVSSREKQTHRMDSAFEQAPDHRSAAAEPVDSSSVLEAKVSAMGGLMSTAHFVIAPSRKFGVTVRGNGTLWIGK